ncbi:MAG TPA: phosphatidate cytidylyltransferase [Gemmatimonadaceae bacterium]|nr:phosphatidate cytidylyltransferase [Gemmatimonadaceae bacterium]
MSELAKRVAFGVVAAPVALAIVFAGGAPLAGLLAIASAIAAWEFYRIARAAGHAPFADLGAALAGIVPLAVHATYLGLLQPRYSYYAAVLLFLLGLSIWARGANGKPLGAVAVTVLGVLYTGGLLSFGYAIRYHDYAVGGVSLGSIPIAAGGILLGLPLVLTWATDTGAYFVGRSVGGRKLIPAVSPGKTVSGAIGGVVTSVLVTWLYVTFLLRPSAQLAMTTASIIVFGIVVSVAAQIGDLVESLLKREAGVKDSGALLPGHGGVLDRLDSLFFVLPTAHLLLGWLLIPAPR